MTHQPPRDGGMEPGDDIPPGEVLVKSVTASGGMEKYHVKWCHRIERAAPYVHTESEETADRRNLSLCSWCSGDVNIRGEQNRDHQEALKRAAEEYAEGDND